MHICSAIMDMDPGPRPKAQKLRAKCQFAPIRGIRGIGGRMPAGHFLCAGIANAPKLLGKGCPFSTKITRSSPWEPKVPQRDPPASQGSQREPKSAQGQQNELQRHPKETTKLQNYIHINEIYANSRSTAIQRPASNNYMK